MYQLSQIHNTIQFIKAVVDFCNVMFSVGLDLLGSCTRTDMLVLYAMAYPHEQEILTIIFNVTLWKGSISRTYDTKFNSWYGLPTQTHYNTGDVLGTDIHKQPDFI